MTTLKLLLQEGDTPNKNGRVYSTELLKRVAESYREDFIKNDRGLVVKGIPENGLTNLTDVVAKVTDLYVEGNALMVEIEKFITPVNGSDVIWELLEANFLYPRMSGGGAIGKDGVVGNNYKLDVIFLTDTPA